MSVDLKKSFQQELNTRLTAETRRYLAEKQYQPDAQTIKDLQEVNAALSNMITERLFQYWQNNRERSADLQKEIALLRDTEKYKKIETMPLTVVEKYFWENLLDCWICQANEIKGMDRIEDRE